MVRYEQRILDTTVFALADRPGAAERQEKDREEKYEAGPLYISQFFLMYVLSGVTTEYARQSYSKFLKKETCASDTYSRRKTFIRLFERRNV